MKKLIAIAVLALAGVTQGATYWSTLNTSARGSATGDANEGYYTAYVCSTIVAASSFGSSEVSALTTYFANHFADHATALSTAGATDLGEAEWSTLGQFGFTKYRDTAVADGDYVGIVFFDNGTDKAVRVFGAGNAELQAGILAFDSDITADLGDWTPAKGTSDDSSGSIPEPSSGLLVLLGSAALALSRKRA